MSQRFITSTQDFHIIVGGYVDDLLIIGNSGERIEEFKKEMKKLFDMTDLGLLSSYLGIQVAQVRAAKCVLRYIKGTLDFRLRYTKSEQFLLTSNSDYVGDYDD
ncbi:unnamed protein product [Spirodela intermedia]|uniref:Reverse transcriptase Ty1/copia-type domain-containing protein n=1 Tax=Spirodela intermedia TaxID=51605 RepID=A0A7I8KXV6_SPIIN|nr:unnamed protein product [Spirodela intermedia]